MPMLPAKEVRKVRPFLVSRFLKLSDRAVPKDIETLDLDRLLWECVGVGDGFPSVESSPS